MNTQEKELQVLPNSCNKKQLTAWYLKKGMTERQIREAINGIIADNRKLGAKSQVRVKSVWHEELMEFVKLHGLPIGYIKSKT